MAERNTNYSRRDMVMGAGLAAGTTLILGQATWAEGKGESRGEARGREDIPKNQLTPMEDLTRQHALVSRVLTVYQMTVRQTGGVGMSPPPMQAIATATEMIRSAVDDFHVRLEEDYLFPLIQKTGKMGDLLSTLREQHAAGRRLTDVILQLTSGEAGGTPNMEALSRNILAYLNWIRPHTAFEESMLYPQIRATLPDRDYEQLQKTFAETTRKKLGTEGFNGLLQKVTELEKSVGVTSLAQWTPKVSTEPVARETPTR
jgi:hemerythrin-like domain-containing protein